jgi:hypothetical protein
MGIFFRTKQQGDMGTEGQGLGKRKSVEDYWENALNRPS